MEIKSLNLHISPKTYSATPFLLNKEFIYQLRNNAEKRLIQKKTKTETVKSQEKAKINNVQKKEKDFIRCDVKKKRKIN